MTRPLTITICGSMHFQPEMNALTQKLSALGHTVYQPIAEEEKIDYTATSDEKLSELKGGFIKAHLEKIRKSDAVLLANYTKNNILVHC